MKATTVFLARVNDSTGTFPFVPVEITKGKPIAPKGASSYYARYSGVRKNGTRGRVVQPLLSTNIEEAYVEFMNVEMAQKQIRAGQTVTVPQASASASVAGQALLKDAIETYLQEGKARNNSLKTIASDTRILHSFRDVCFANGVYTIETFKDAKLGRKVLLAYLVWMQDNLDTVDVDGARPANTWNKRMNRISTFFKPHGVKVKKNRNAGLDDAGLLMDKEFPKYKSKKATRYSEETIAAWLKAATVDEGDLIEFFLATGFRDEEVAHIEWADINWANKTVNVKAKAKTASRAWEWKPKDGESREEDIPLSDAFVARMKARQSRYASQKCSLIFPSGVCKPNDNLLRIARRAAKRAGITERIGFHTIRKTVGSNLAAKYGVKHAMAILGHSDLATTQGYLAENEKSFKQMREDLNKKGTLVGA